jgi:hypothetical protein
MGRAVDVSNIQTHDVPKGSLAIYRYTRPQSYCTLLHFPLDTFKNCQIKVEEASLLGCHAASTYKSRQTFRKMVVPWSSGSSSPRRVTGLLDPERTVTTILQTSVTTRIYLTVWRNISNNLKLQQHRYKNLKSRRGKLILMTSTFCTTEFLSSFFLLHGFHEYWLSY